MVICNRFIYVMFRDWNRIPIHIFFGFIFGLMVMIGGVVYMVITKSEFID